MLKFDLIDRKVLSELSANCRQDQSELAKKLKLGRDRIKYRIGKLRQNGVIKDFVALINSSKLGITIYKTYFRLNSDRKTVNRLLAYLDRHPRSFWVAECAGQWDLIVATFARTPKEYSLLLDELLAAFNSCILELSVYTLTDAWYLGRGYLNGETFSRTYVGGIGDPVPVDELDFQILRYLASDARMTYTAIAEGAQCSLATARSRVERLEELGVVAYYRVELDLAKLGRWFYKAQLYFTEHDPRREDELRAYCESEPDILFLIKQIGSCRLEIELEVESFETYNQTIDRLRDRFGGYIKRIDTIVIRKQRIRGVPMDLRSVESAAVLPARA